MKAIILLFGSLSLCFAAPVEEHHEREARSASGEQGLKALLTEVKETLASVNQKTNIEQPMMPPRQEVEPPPTHILQMPSDSANNPESSPTHINLVISTQPQHQAEPPQQPQLQQPVQPFTGVTTTDLNTLLLSRCGQLQPNGQIAPCPLMYSGLQQPGLGLYPQYKPYLTNPNFAAGTYLNPISYPSLGYNYGVPPINPQFNPYAGYNMGMGMGMGLGMTPPLSISPPIIFREGPTPVGLNEAQT